MFTRTNCAIRVDTVMAKNTKRLSIEMHAIYAVPLKTSQGAITKICNNTQNNSQVYYQSKSKPFKNVNKLVVIIQIIHQPLSLLYKIVRFAVKN